MSQFKSKGFKELQKEWYSRLKESGFEDIEDLSSPRENLKQFHSSRFYGRARTIERFTSIKAYYEEANLFLLEFEFGTEEERIIWKLHCNGLSLRKISKAIKLLNIKYQKSTIGNIITKLTDVMRSDTWREKQSQKFIKKIS